MYTYMYIYIYIYIQRERDTHISLCIYHYYYDICGAPGHAAEQLEVVGAYLYCLVCTGAQYI